MTNKTGNEKKNRPPLSALSHTLILLGVGCVFILFVMAVQPFFSLSLWLSDRLFISEPPSPNIVVVGIDDATLGAYGSWADWPRSYHTRAIDNLNKAKARVIGFDILFAESRPDDETLAAAMQGSENVIIPLVGTGPQPSSGTQITFSQVIAPTSLLEQAANVGHGNISTDPDGKVRRLPLVIASLDGQTYPAFSLVVLEKLLSLPLPEQYLQQDGKLNLLDRYIPVDDSYYYRINYSSEDAERPYISYKDIISGDFDPALVADKVVLIGMVATGELDKWVAPTSSDKVPGVFIQAAVMDNILRQRFVTDVSSTVTLIILVALLAVAAFTLPRLKLRWGGLIVGVLFIGYLLASFVAFEKGYILNMLYPLLMLPILYVGSSLTQNVAMAIENTKLNIKVMDGYKSTIRALAAAIDAKDHYTRGHSQRVTRLALLGAAALKMSPRELEVFEYAGILHDIGKIGIPDNILGKPGPLTNDEYDIIKQHPEIGANMISDIPFLEEARKVVLYHHERYDGNGYPHGLSGEEIPLGARLLAVADAFDSMTSDRAYRAAMSTEGAVNELYQHRGTQFCPIAVEAFISGLKAHREISSGRL